MAKIEEITDENAKPSSMLRLGTTDDWAITVWCDQCDVWHHYLAEKIPKGKSFDVWELAPHPGQGGSLKRAPKKKAAKKAPPKDGELLYFGRFKSVDEATEKIEEELSTDDEYDHGDEDDDGDEDEDDAE